ncbi:MAG: hypothetical protein KDA87_17070, partial [Planctomycetales bacterium]|nr:hypothetical protein [Planctomycetales bacterium]
QKLLEPVINYRMTHEKRPTTIVTPQTSHVGLRSSMYRNSQTNNWQHLLRQFCCDLENHFCKRNRVIRL